VASGHRLLGKSTKGLSIVPDLFNAHSSLSLSGIKMGAINIADYFSITLGGKDEIEDLGEGGNIPIVSTSEFDNGVTAWKTARTIYAPRTITVATDGSTCSSFVQEFPFYAFYKVAILRPKVPNVPIDALYYFAYLLKQERWRYVYARKFGKTRISTTVIYCPIKSNKSPDFEMMSKLTQQCTSYPIIASFREAYSDMAKQGEAAKSV
jgi:type I restriction enzyme M protein